MSKYTYGLSPEIEQYLQAHSVNEHPAQEALRNATENVDRSVMISSSEMGNFLQFMVGLIGARRCIEVGVYTGYSALSIALSLPDDGVLQAFDISEEWTSVGKPYWDQAGVANKINLVIQPASTSLQALIKAGEAGTYDFAFIDADKAGYVEYYEQCMELLRPNGIIVLDNTLWGWKIHDQSLVDEDTVGLRRVNELVYNDPRVHQSIIPFGDGCTVIRKR